MSPRSLPFFRVRYLFVSFFLSSFLVHFRGTSHFLCLTNILFPYLVFPLLFQSTSHPRPRPSTTPSSRTRTRSLRRTWPSRPSRPGCGGPRTALAGCTRTGSPGRRGAACRSGHFEKNSKQLTKPGRDHRQLDQRRHPKLRHGLRRTRSVTSSSGTCMEARATGYRDTFITSISSKGISKVFSLNLSNPRERSFADKKNFPPCPF